MTPEQDRHLSHTLQTTLTRCSQQSSSEDARKLSSLSLESLCALSDLRPTYGSSTAYTNVNTLPWRLAQAVYLYIHTLENESEYQVVFKPEELLSIAESIKSFMQLLSRETKERKPASRQREEQARVILKKLAAAHALKKMHVQDAVYQLVGIHYPESTRPEDVHIIQRDASSVTLKKNDSRIKVTFDVA